MANPFGSESQMFNATHSMPGMPSMVSVNYAASGEFQECPYDTCGHVVRRAEDLPGAVDLPLSTGNLKALLDKLLKHSFEPPWRAAPYERRGSTDDASF